MDVNIPKFATPEQAGTYISTLGASFAMVRNPPYIFPPFEAYPLAEPRVCLDDGFVAAVMDMDGTTTTTEALCIESLAVMVSSMSGNGKDGACRALDHERDYPHIIGNSTTRHVEYLVQRYREGFKPEAICAAFIRAVAWTTRYGFDPGRIAEARTTLRAQGLGELWEDPDFLALRENTERDSAAPVSDGLGRLGTRWLPRLRMRDITDLTRIGIEIYYQHYHELLGAIDRGIRRTSSDGRHLIEPMPGIGIALALLKGWLGEEAPLLGDRLAAQLRERGRGDAETVAGGMAKLGTLGRYFQTHPVRVALVTSSIATEVAIVIKEVFRVISLDIPQWGMSSEREERLLQAFSEPAHVYDASITATDSSEIRLKPHRDLYSIALYTLGVAPDAFHRVAGFEDSESGTIAIRAAGIGLSCALPFAMTTNHRFEAATQICHGGLPEVILLKQFFLRQEMM